MQSKGVGWWVLEGRKWAQVPIAPGPGAHEMLIFLSALRKALSDCTSVISLKVPLVQHVVSHYGLWIRPSSKQVEMQLPDADNWCGYGSLSQPPIDASTTAWTFMKPSCLGQSFWTWDLILAVLRSHWYISNWLGSNCAFLGAVSSTSELGMMWRKRCSALNSGDVWLLCAMLKSTTCCCFPSFKAQRAWSPQGALDQAWLAGHLN